MTQFHVVNSLATAIEVPIVNKTTGEKDSVFVQPGARPKLPPEFVVQDEFAKMNPRVTSVSVEDSKAQAARLSNLGNYFSRAEVGSNKPPAPTPVAQEPAVESVQAERSNRNK